jgi:hypothetical protein
MYRAEVTTVEGFVQQLAVSYLSKGYWFYVTGEIPTGKDPRAVDDKLISRYGIDLSKWARARRKQAGTANLQYLRYGRFFVLLATYGKHRFFEEEAQSIRDARRVPIRFYGYSISYRGGHPHVRIEQGEYNRRKAYFVGRAVHRPVEELARELRQLPFEPYAPVRRQLLVIWRAVNQARQKMGREPVPKACLRFKRRICRPFALPPDREVA